MEKLSRREADLIHKHTANHREEIMSSTRCWCISCEREFPPSRIDDWTDNGETALCPCCCIDAIVGDASGFSLTKQQLKHLNKIYFQPKNSYLISDLTPPSHEIIPTILASSEVDTPRNVGVASGACRGYSDIVSVALLGGA